MTATTTQRDGFTIREGRTRVGNSIEAVLDGESHPFVQAVQIADDGGPRHWLLMVGYEVPKAAGITCGFPAPVRIGGGESVRGEVRVWVEMLARLHMAAVTR